jgi:hypothetical protein
LTQITAIRDDIRLLQGASKGIDWLSAVRTNVLSVLVGIASAYVFLRRPLAPRDSMPAACDH